MPGGPFNVGSGGFPASFLSIGCGIHLVANRAQLRADAALSAAIVTELTIGFLGGGPPAAVTFKCRTGPTIRGRAAVIAVHADLAQMLNAYDGHLDLPHAGPPGPAGPAGQPGAVGATGALGRPGLVGPVGELPTLGTPDFNTLLQSITAAIAIFRPFQEPREGGLSVPGLLDPLPQPDFEEIRPGPLRPGTPQEQAVLQRVAAGGTVNFPVVPGSTSDPSGTQAPRFPDTNRERAFEVFRLLLPQIANEIAQRRAARRARALIREQLNAFRAALAARQQQLERERRAPAMPFGQAGVSTIQLRGPGGSEDGGGLIETIISILPILFPGLNLPLPGFPSLPNQPRIPEPPPQLPQLPPGIPGLSPPLGGAGACDNLFRAGAGAMRVSPVPWFPVQAPNGKWFFFGHLGKPTFSKLKSPRRHHHHPRKR